MPSRATVAVHNCSLLPPESSLILNGTGLHSWTKEFLLLAPIFCLHFDYILTIYDFFWLTDKGGIDITNFWSIVLDDHWSKRSVDLRWLFDLVLLFILRWSCLWLDWYKVSSSCNCRKTWLNSKCWLTRRIQWLSPILLFHTQNF